MADRYFNMTADLKDKDFDRSKPFKSSQMKIHKKEKWIKKKKEKTPQELQELKIQKKERRKKHQKKKRRIIIRNLSFKVEEEELKKILSQFGNVVELTIPKTPEGRKRGFAFAQFDDFFGSLNAIKKLNMQKIRDRPVAVDYAISKEKYEHVVLSKKTTVEKPPEEKAEEEDDDEDDSDDEEDMQNDEQEVEEDAQEDTIIDEKEKRASKLLKELDFKPNSDDEDDENSENSDDDSMESDKSSDDENDEMDSGDQDNEEDEDDDTEDSPSKAKNKAEAKKQSTWSSNDAEEGKTIFIRNISFETTEEILKEALEEFGEMKYCLLCMDKITELSRGTAFVKFENKEDAEKLIKKASEEKGIFLDGRKLFVVLAVTQNEIQKKFDKDSKEKKDKRNLALLKEGLIAQNSEEAESLPPADKAKRAKLEIAKRQKLKSLNFFVSRTRLMVHNIPSNYTDITLRKLFKEAAGPKSIVTEARIMKEVKKVNSKGQPQSKGFGFVAFTCHEDALEALQKLNNNPTTFHPQKRPIVEFSVENHQALLTKQRRAERNKKRFEKQQSMQEAEATENKSSSAPVARKFQKNKKWKKKQGKETPKKEKVQVSPKRKFVAKGPHDKKFKKQKKRPDKKTNTRPKDDKSFKKLVDNYKTKLMKKF